MRKQKRAIFSNVFTNISIQDRNTFVTDFSSMIGDFLKEYPDILGNVSLTVYKMDNINNYRICIGSDNYPDTHLDIIIRFRSSDCMDEIETLVVDDNFQYHELTCDSLAYAQDKIGKAVEKFLEQCS